MSDTNLYHRRVEINERLISAKKRLKIEFDELQRIKRKAEKQGKRVAKCERIIEKAVNDIVELFPNIEPMRLK